MNFHALLSDLDGTLADTEPVHANTWLEVLSQYGLQFDHDWFQQWVGTSDFYLAKQVISRHGLDIEIKELQVQKRDLFHQRVVQQGELFPGVKEAMAQLFSAVPVAIVTNSGRLDAEHIFQATEIDQYAQLSITADDVEEMKPAPEGYKLAANMMGMLPEHCVAIEDSRAGSQAAWDAGCYVLGIDHGQVGSQLNAHEVFPTPAAAFQRAMEMLEVTVAS
ncbi:MAG: HAD family phosphatase [Bacteroidota bacterium]